MLAGDFLPFWAFKGGKLMGLQTGVSGVCGEELESFLYRLIALGKPFIGFEPVKLCPVFIGEEDCKQGRPS